MRTASLGIPLFFAVASAACFLRAEDSCFVRGTRVRTPRGDVPIEHLAVGDEVLSLRTDDGAVVVRRIERVLTAEVDEVIVLDVDGDVIVTTREHPFWDAERGRWTRAGAITPGTVLVQMKADGATAPARVHRVQAERRPGTPVWNLTVEGPEHTYFAGGVAVHNKSPLVRCEPPGCDPSPTEEPGEEILLTERLLSEDVVISITAFAPDEWVSLAPSILADAPAQSVSLRPPSGVFRPLGVVTLFDGAEARRVPGSVLAFPNGERFLVAGGAAEITVSSGRLALEEVEPTTKILALSADGSHCPSERFASPLSWSFPAAAEGGITIDEEGWDEMAARDCVALVTSGGPMTVCVPRYIWPFAPGDEITASSLEAPRDGAIIASATAELILERMTVDEGESAVTVADVPLTIESDMSCTWVAPTCDATRALARAVRADGEAIERGRPIQDAAGAEHWIVGAYAVPIRRQGCSGEGAVVEVASRRRP
jgi:hypothetical protein